MGKIRKYYLRHRNLESIDENEVLRYGPPTLEEVAEAESQDQRISHRTQDEDISPPPARVIRKYYLRHRNLESIDENEVLRFGPPTLAEVVEAESQDQRISHRTQDEDISPPPARVIRKYYLRHRNLASVDENEVLRFGPPTLAEVAEAESQDQRISHRTQDKDISPPPARVIRKYYLRHRNLESIDENEVLQFGPPTLAEVAEAESQDQRISHSPVKESPNKEVANPIGMSDHDISAHQMVVTADVHRTQDDDISSPPSKKRKYDSDKRQTRSQAQRSSVHPTTAAEVTSAPDPETLQPDPVPINDQETNVTRTSGYSNEAQLGSLERTNFSVDTHHGETELKQYLNEHWGTEATFKRIVQLRRKDKKVVLDVPSLVHAQRSRRVAAKCFSSLLNLNHHNFVKWEQDDETSEITNIHLTNKDLID